MNAAVVRDVTRPPQWIEFADPLPNQNETIVTVRAAAVSPLVRGRASGAHYSSLGADSFVAGVDGVGIAADGRRVFFGFARPPFGSMAERAPVRLENCVDIPEDLDDATAAALGNPGMSSWVALRSRAAFVAGESVLINGATGTAGRLAVRIAKHLGARSVVVTGRSAEILESLRAEGADDTISLALEPSELETRFDEALREYQVNVVLDYLWGASAERIIAAIARNDSGAVAPRIRFVQIGAVSGPEIALPAAVLRSSGLEILGSGLRSVSNATLLESIGEMLRWARSAGLSVDVATAPLSDVENAWQRDWGAKRLVLIADHS
ncbi:MAG TPA: zinc-binding alcohol dehydrogenase family protein [Candidatus Tumulicola sp.]|jgi:NADPH:quinone reductase-like Zn-dependent oxidoreductase